MNNVKVIESFFNYMLIELKNKQYKITKEAFDFYNGNKSVKLEALKYLTHYNSIITKFDLKNQLNPKVLNKKKLNIGSKLLSNNDKKEVVGNSLLLKKSNLSNSKTTIPHYYLKKEIIIDNYNNFIDKYSLNSDKDLLYKLIIIRSIQNMIKNNNYNINNIYNDSQLLFNEQSQINVETLGNKDSTFQVTNNDSIYNILDMLKGSVNNNVENKYPITKILFLDNYTIDNYYPIIENFRNSAISVSNIKRKLDTDNNIINYLNITASFDHRIIDGAVGAKILSEIEAGIKEPLSILI